MRQLTRKSRWLPGSGRLSDLPASSKFMMNAAYESTNLLRDAAKHRHSYVFPGAGDLPSVQIGTAWAGFALGTSLRIPWLVSDLHVAIDAIVYFTCPVSMPVRLRLRATQLVAAFTTVEGSQSETSANMPQTSLPIIPMHLNAVLSPDGTMRRARLSLTIASPPTDRRIALGVQCKYDGSALPYASTNYAFVHMLEITERVEAGDT